MAGSRGSPNGCDVLVAGGGPAGLAGAIAIAARGLSVTVVDSGRNAALDRCEMLASAAEPLVHRLGIRDALNDAVSLEGVTSHWGAVPRHENSFRQPNGWSVERQSIDTVLRERAKELGAKLRWSSVRSVTGRPGAWRVSLGADDMSSEASTDCRYIVDATGRQASVARALGAHLEVGRDLVALLYRTTSSVPHRLLAEAAPNGWWYSLPRLRGGATVGYVTSGKFAKEMRRSLARTDLDEIGSLVPRPIGVIPRLYDSRSSRLSQCSGPGWVAAGDAASAFDPISSQGLFNALSSGFFAGNAVADTLAGQQSAADVYRLLIERTALRTHVVTPWQYAASGRSTSFWNARSKPVFKAQEERRMFQPPANQDDLANHPDLKKAFMELWNHQSPGGKSDFFMGDFITSAARRPNFVDPRKTPPVGDAVGVPWNGFPRLMSRYYQDTTSEGARARAEEVAEVLTPEVYWFVQRDGEFRTNAALANLLPLFVEDDLGLEELTQIARPLRAFLPGDVVGDEVPQYRRQQDEYLEWHADRNADGTIRRICFTAEPPDYWEALAAIAPARVVELYREHVNQEIEKADLFYPERLAIFGRFENGTYGWREVEGLGGRYNPLNPWTTTRGVMHLTHGANTLGAEVTLAGDASVPRTVDDLPVTPGQDPAPEILRIACGAYGGINRSSDPNIGKAVGDQIHKGNRITLTDPVGLYIAKIDLKGLIGPTGQQLEHVAGKITRGKDDSFEPRILRYVVELPAGSNFTLSDCKFDNRPLLRAAQIGRESTVQLYVNIYPGGADTKEAACRGQACRHPDNGQIFDIVGATSNCEPPDSPSWLTATPYEGAAKGAPEAVSSDWHEPEMRVLESGTVKIERQRGYIWNNKLEK